MVVKVSLNLRGINQVMKAPGVGALLQQRAEALAAEAGDGFEATADNSHPWIARAWVHAETVEAKISEAADKVLTKAVGRLAGGS